MRLSRPLLVAALGFAAAPIVSCSGVKADAGDDAFMQIPSGQFVRGPMPQGSAKGPAVLAINLVSNDFWPSFLGDPIGATLAPAATAAAVGLQGDVGYWVVLAGVPSISTPTDPSLSTSADFSSGIVPGNYTLVVRAVDKDGNFGLPSAQVITATESPMNPPATGELVVTLTWDTESNLNLHVVDPNGTEIFWGNQSSQPPFSFDQMDGGSYGYIDYDSNANCIIDGLRREDAIWAKAPPSGQYTVRVDTASLCGQPDAYWTVKVVLHGSTIAEATGVGLDADTMGSHGVGAGVLALQFAVP